MVKMEYVNGDTETIETVKNDTFVCRFAYDEKSQCFIVCDKEKVYDCVHIPREFLKSIRCVDVDN